MPDLSPYVGRWVAMVHGHVAGVGRSADEALHLAKRNRPKEKPRLLYVSPDVQIARAAERYPLIQRVFDLASARQVPTYLVGGSVRDLLLGTETHDLDFAVEGDGLALARYVANKLGGAYVALDQERRTGRALLPPRDGFRLCLDIAALRGDDLTADLRDRDFTINAMALERTPDGHWLLFDPLGGSDDLMNGILRTASPSSFINDPLRTMRAVRMHTQFGCEIEPQTQAWLRSAVPLLDRVSAERIRDEWFKILKHVGAADALRELHQLGLLRTIAPPIVRLEGLTQSAPHRFDALTHSFEIVGAVERLWAALQGQRTKGQIFLPDSLYALAPGIRQRYESPVCNERTHLVLLKCAAFLHDVGKPRVKETTQDGKIRFIGHERAGAEIAARLGRQWRCSNTEIDMLRTAVEAHMRPTWLATQPALTRRAIHRFFRDTGEYGIDAAFIALADYLATWGPDLPVEGWKRQVETVAKLWTAYYEQRKTVIEPPPLLSGNDLIATWGLSPGPKIGELLARVREAQAAGEIGTRDEAVACVREWLGE